MSNYSVSQIFSQIFLKKKKMEKFEAEGWGAINDNMLCPVDISSEFFFWIHADSLNVTCQLIFPDNSL
jgi:hypothetical protein